MQESLYLGDMFVGVHRSFKPSERALLYLPGLPSRSASVEGEAESLPLISSLAPALTSRSVDVLAPRYPGLDESLGDFGLLRCVYMGLSALSFALSRYRSVSVLGRSFGGLVAIAACSSVAGARALDKVILLAPALGLPQGSGMNELANSWSSIFRRPESEIALDLEEIQRRWNPINGLKMLDADKVTVICGRRDMVIPAPIVRDYLETLAKQPALIEIDSDHDFSDRTDLLQHILFALEKMC